MEFEIVQFEQQPTAAVRGRVPIAELPMFFGRAYGQLFETLGRQGVVPAGPPFAYYPSEPSDVVDVEAGVTIAGELEDTADVVSSHLPGGRAVVGVHVGPYEALEQTYRSLLAEIERAGLVRRLGMWEEYLTDPDSEPDPVRWRTRVVMPIAC